MLYFFHELFLIFIVLLVVGSVYFNSKVLAFLLIIFFIIYRKTLYCFCCIIRLYFHGLRKNYTKIPKIIKEMYTNIFSIRHNFDKLPKYNTIFVCNHPYNPIDFCATKLLPIKFCGVVGGINVAKFFIKPISGDSDYIFFNMNKSNNFNTIKTQIKEKIQQTSILVFVERYSLMVSQKNIAPLRSGIFRIAKDLNISITPLLIDSVRTSNGIINTQPFEIVIGETMMVTNVKCDCRNVRKFMLKEKRRLESNKDMFI
jgi:hypothetical protein